MKKILLIILLLIPVTAFSQTDDEKYYIYQIISFGDSNKEGLKVFVDDGKKVERLKDENGKKIIFTTPAGAFMYFLSKGWEFYSIGSTSQGAVMNGIGGSSSSSYWIIRKPCTKEDFQAAVEDAIKK
jgi:hypothetical protein